MAIYIALGANLGDRRANLVKALERLEPEVHVEAVSALYESPPQLPAPPPSYLNAACRVRTRLQPRELLAYLKRIEREMGRERAQRWAPRPIDLDIALYDDRIVEDGDLVIPHPRIGERAFVLRPLLDLDPDLVDPATGERLADVLTRVDEDGLMKLAPSGWQRTSCSP